MHISKLHYLFGIVIVTLCLSVIPLQSSAAPQGQQKVTEPDKERLVLMPLRVDEEDKNLLGAMETALVEGLKLKYVVFSGEQVSQKAHQIFMKETHVALEAHRECDATRCLQNIGEAFQAELIAIANVTKKDGGYFLALSIQNIFDNKVEFSKTMTCEDCNAFKVVEKLKILSAVVASNINDTTNEETQADRKLKAEQLIKEQREFEDKLRNADAAERKRLLDAKAADDKRLAELKAAAEARRKNTQPTTIPTLEQAQAEVKKLNDQIAVIEAGYEKELVDTRKQVTRRYSEKLDSIKSEPRGEFESRDEFNAKQDKKRNELISQREAELARLNVSTVAETETAPLKTRIKSLTDHEYVVGAESIEAELGSFDADEHEFSIKLRSKSAAFSLKLKSIIPMQSKDAEAFKKQWQSGLVRPEAKVKIKGEVIELSLINDSEIGGISNSQLFEFKESQWARAKSVFYTRAKAAELADAEIIRPGRKFKDCDDCPTMVVLPPVNGVSIAEAEITRGDLGISWTDIPQDTGLRRYLDRYKRGFLNQYLISLSEKTGKHYFEPSHSDKGNWLHSGVFIARTLP